MTNRIVFVIAALIAAFFLVDAFFLHVGVGLFLARRFANLVEYLAFWR